MKLLLVSNAERLLVEAIKNVEYGELYDVRVADEPPSFEENLRNGNAALLEFMRDEGYIYIPLILVHNQEVKQIEVVGEKNGFRYRRKIRF